ncbi:MAG: hypothetical protein ACPGLV_07530 [Bacteroidia bacterium]
MSCNKDVNNVPIQINDGGWGDTELTDRLKEKLVDYGFLVVEDGSAAYEMVVEDYYTVQYEETVSAPKDDCYNYYYDLDTYEASYIVSLYKDGSKVDTWDDDREAQDSVEEEVEQTKSYCTEYYVNDVVDPRDGFFSSNGRWLAKQARNYVNDNE